MMVFRLRRLPGDSPPYPAESDSLYCGLLFCFQLLSTPPHGDAVTFSYDVMAYADRDLHPADFVPSWAHWERFPDRDFEVGKQGNNIRCRAYEGYDIFLVPTAPAWECIPILLRQPRYGFSRRIEGIRKNSHAYYDCAYDLNPSLQNAK